MELLGSDREAARNKIILLYIIEKLKIPMTNLQLTKLVTGKKIMNYFLMQQFLNELCECNLLSANPEDGKTFYIITEDGRQMLGNLINLIPQGIRAKLDNITVQIRKSILSELKITADYIPENENEYIVSCKVSEGDFLIADINVTVGTKKDARFLCENWKKYYCDIYPEIIEILTRKRNKDGVTPS